MPAEQLLDLLGHHQLAAALVQLLAAAGQLQVPVLAHPAQVTGAQPAADQGLPGLHPILPDHLIRIIRGGGDEKLFFYLVLNRAQANLAMARRDLRMIEQQFYMSTPKAGRGGETQAYYPAGQR